MGFYRRMSFPAPGRGSCHSLQLVQARVLLPGAHQLLVKQRPDC